MKNTISKEDTKFLVDECLRHYREQLEVRLNEEEKVRIIWKIIKGKRLFRDLWWYDNGFRDAMHLIFDKLGGGKYLEDKETEVFKEILLKHPELEKRIKDKRHNL